MVRIGGGVLLTILGHSALAAGIIFPESLGALARWLRNRSKHEDPLE
jgi:hypothetical protein